MVSEKTRWGVRVSFLLGDSKAHAPLFLLRWHKGKPSRESWEFHCCPVLVRL